MIVRVACAASCHASPPRKPADAARSLAPPRPPCRTTQIDHPDGLATLHHLVIAACEQRACSVQREATGSGALGRSERAHEGHPRSSHRLRSTVLGRSSCWGVFARRPGARRPSRLRSQLHPLNIQCTATATATAATAPATSLLLPYTDPPPDRPSCLPHTLRVLLPALPRAHKWSLILRPEALRPVVVYVCTVTRASHLPKII